MTKLKTHKGAAKRFKKTKNGKVKSRRAYRGHIMEKKSPKRKRQLRKAGILTPEDTKRISGII